MIEGMLLNKAITGGLLSFEDRGDEFYRLVVKVIGLNITIARLTKQEAKEAMKPKLGIVS